MKEPLPGFVILLPAPIAACTRCTVLDPTLHSRAVLRMPFPLASETRMASSIFGSTRARPIGFPLLCRFSDAGSDEPLTHSGGRRLKSAKARNRGKWGHRRCRGLYGDLTAASGWARLVRAPAPIALPRRMGVGDGLNERSGRCRTGLAVRLRTDFLTCSKRGLCWPRANQNGERHWAGGSAVRAS